MVDDARIKPAESNALEQYKELCSDGRHYDQKLWIIQSAAYATSAIIYNAMLGMYGGRPKVVIGLALANVIVFWGYLFQYVKDRAFQLENQDALVRLQGVLGGMVEVAQYSGDLKIDQEDTLVVRLLKARSATVYVVRVMVLILIADLALLVHFTSKWLATCPWLP